MHEDEADGSGREIKGVVMVNVMKTRRQKKYVENAERSKLVDSKC